MANFWVSNFFEGSKIYFLCGVSWGGWFFGGGIICLWRTFGIVVFWLINDCFFFVLLFIFLVFFLFFDFGFCFWFVFVDNSFFFLFFFVFFCSLCVFGSYFF